MERANCLLGIWLFHFADGTARKLCWIQNQIEFALVGVFWLGNGVGQPFTCIGELWLEPFRTVFSDCIRLCIFNSAGGIGHFLDHTQQLGLASPSPNWDGRFDSVLLSVLGVCRANSGLAGRDELLYCLGLGRVSHTSSVAISFDFRRGIKNRREGQYSPV